MLTLALSPLSVSTAPDTALQAAASTPRIAWLHVPKTGTSFATTLMHYANATLPKDAAANNGGFCRQECDPTLYEEGIKCNMGQIHATTFPVKYPLKTWFKGVFPADEDTRPKHTNIA